MSVDEIDTILLIEKTIADTLATKANFTAKLHTNGQR